MKLPPAITEVKDTANRVLWHIRAYRTVTEPEARTAIAAYVRQNGIPKQNKMIEIITTIGLHD